MKRYKADRKVFERTVAVSIPSSSCLALCSARRLSMQRFLSSSTTLRVTLICQTETALEIRRVLHYPPNKIRRMYPGDVHHLFDSQSHAVHLLL